MKDHLEPQVTRSRLQPGWKSTENRPVESLVKLFQTHLPTEDSLNLVIRLAID